MVSGSKAVEPIDCIGTKAVTRDWRHSAKQTSNAHNAPTPKRNNPETQQPHGIPSSALEFPHKVHFGIAAARAPMP